MNTRKKVAALVVAVNVAIGAMMGSVSAVAPADERGTGWGTVRIKQAAPRPTVTVTTTATATVTATVTETVTTTATVTETVTVEPDPDPDPPPATGFPDASNTGPTGTLTAYTGPSNITTAGTVIENKTIGCIEVSAPSVVIRNSKISCAGWAVYVDDVKGYPWTQAQRLLLEDVEIDCKNGNGTGIAEAHVTVRRADIHHCENGLSINQNITIEDSYIHDLFGGNDAHADGIQLSFGHWNGSSYPCCAKNVVIRHNTIWGIHADGSFGTSSIIMNPSADQDVLVENNLMAGGAATVYCNRPGSGNNVRLINNHFSTQFKSTVGWWFASDDCGDEILSGNVYHETGEPIALN